MVRQLNQTIMVKLLMYTWSSIERITQDQQYFLCYREFYRKTFVAAEMGPF